MRPRVTGANGGRNLGGAHRRGFAARGLAHQHQRVDVAGLALIGAHAGGGVALQMLDRAVILPCRQTDVARRSHRFANRRIACPPRRGVCGCASERPAPPHGRRRRCRAARAAPPDFAPRDSTAASRANTPAQAPTLHTPGRGTVRHEHRRIFDPAQLTARLRMQVHGRREAAGAQDRDRSPVAAGAPRRNPPAVIVQPRTARAPPTLTSRVSKAAERGSEPERSAPISDSMSARGRRSPAITFDAARRAARPPPDRPNRCWPQSPRAHRRRRRRHARICPRRPPA